MVIISVIGALIKINFSTHPDGTTTVGAFGTYGYGLCDMAGNVWEWTSSMDNVSNYVVRGGYWISDVTFCTTTCRPDSTPSSRGNHLGFRLVTGVTQP